MRRILQTWWSHLAFVACLGTMGVPAASAQAPPEAPSAPPGTLVRRVSSYPQFLLDGKPYFVHSATFFYFRMPRDLWEMSLERHRQLGINTIDLLIPWNWHEPRDGEFDFDGHSNPRRDLRGLLQLITEKGFHLIARPALLVGDDWRHAGYPEWLLARPEYNMDRVALLEGRPPPLAALAARDPEAAARGWLANATHMEYARRWLAALARELARYSPQRTVTIRVRDEKGENWETKTVPGPLLLVEAGNFALAGRTYAGGPAVERYTQELVAALEAGGLEGPFFLYAGQEGGVRAGLQFGSAGAWFPRPVEGESRDAFGDRRLTARDVTDLEFSVERLKTQPDFPPALLDFQAGWHAPADDARAVESDPANTLLASRLLLSHGARGLNYFPAQDSLTPAGYDTPAANRFYRWDAPLDIAGDERPRSRGVLRNARALAVWGDLLAASHKRADFAVALPLGEAGDEESARLVRAAKQIERIAYLAGLSSVLVDPESQPVEDLLRHPLVVLPGPALSGVEGSAGPRDVPLSEGAQRVLVEYVRRGGTLVVCSPRPAGKILDPLWTARPAAPPGGFAGLGGSPTTWNFGGGRVMDGGPDFYSWVDLDDSFSDNRLRGEAIAAIKTLEGFLESAQVRPAVERGIDGPALDELAITQRVSDTGSSPLGGRAGGPGLLFVTNLSYDDSLEESVRVLSPRAGPRGPAEDYIPLTVQLPPRESLLLPLNYPLCSEAQQKDSCTDEVVAAGAELLRVQRDGKTLELTFYAPGRATATLRLRRKPRRVELDEYRPKTEWATDRKELTVTLPRGAWPDFKRKLRVRLSYTPGVPAKPKERRARRDFDYAVIDAVRLPLAADAVLLSFPPLVLIDEENEGRFLVEARNYDDLGRDVDIKVEGPVRGSEGIGLSGDETRQTVVTVKLDESAEAAGGNGPPSPVVQLLEGDMGVRSGGDRRHSPISFLVPRKEGTTAYTFDFDRDGASEWVLENANVRAMISPAAGGQVVALVDKASRANLLSSVGGMLDVMMYGRATHTLNRAYAAEAVPAEEETAIRLRYAIPEEEGGGQLEKTVHLFETNGAQVDYFVQPAVPGTFAALNSVPALTGDRGTQFCWKEAADAPEPKCEAFVPGHPDLTLPPGVSRLEIRTPGLAGLVMEWNAGEMHVDMKNYSALLRLELPVGPKVPAKWWVRYRVIPGE